MPGPYTNAGPDGGEHRSNAYNERLSRALTRALMQQRRVEARDLAMQSSGFSDAIQAQLRSHEPNQLHTSIARPTDDLTTSYVEAPRKRTRAELIKERNQAHLKALHATASHPGPDTNTRVQQRVDMGIQTQLTAPAGKSRAALLAARRQRRAAENEELAAAYGVDPAATFSSQVCGPRGAIVAWRWCRWMQPHRHAPLSQP